MRTTITKALCFTSLFATLTACTDDGSPDEEPLLSDTEQAVTCPSPAININRSLAVTDTAILAKFPFKRVMNKLIATGKGTNTSLGLYKDWMTTWATCGAGVDPNGYGITCARPESQFAAFDPFQTTGPRFVPIALMNRFDLAPSNGADCGEYRILYALKDSPGDRGFLIFEARLPNPDTAAGLEGCRAVADFWGRLSNDADVNSRATKLEKFYFAGLVADGKTFSPVVTAANYGLDPSGKAIGKGQIRTNFFADFFEWHLREFKLGKPCAGDVACKLSVTQVTVKTNPADELFRGTHANAPAFQAAFLKQVGALSSKNAATVGMTIGNKFNEWESSSQAGDVIYDNFTKASFKNQITGAITNPNLTADNILDRATTQTCGGCHESSNFKPDLGDGVTWQPSLGFVQVDELSRLSDGLTKVFLPHRKTVLKKFLDAQCARTGIEVDPEHTIGGSALDAAN